MNNQDLFDYFQYQVVAVFRREQSWILNLIYPIIKYITDRVISPSKYTHLVMYKERTIDEIVVVVHHKLYTTSKLFVNTLLTSSGPGVSNRLYFRWYSTSVCQLRKWLRDFLQLHSLFTPHTTTNSVRPIYSQRPIDWPSSQTKFEKHYTTYNLS